MPNQFTDPDLIKKNYPEYKNWQSMKSRCDNINGKYKREGVKICLAWRTSFWIFLHEMGPKPSPSHTLERIDDNYGYRPGNVRWATKSEQQVHRRMLKNNKSGYRGVSYRATADRWRTCIQYQGKARELGQYRTPEEAARAYDIAAAELHGANAQLNGVQ